MTKKRVQIRVCLLWDWLQEEPIAGLRRALSDGDRESGLWRLPIALTSVLLITFFAISLSSFAKFRKGYQRTVLHSIIHSRWRANKLHRTR